LAIADSDGQPPALPGAVLRRFLSVLAPCRRGSSRERKRAGHHAARRRGHHFFVANWWPVGVIQSGYSRLSGPSESLPVDPLRAALAAGVAPLKSAK
jgi:hypothetical protein